MRLIAGGILLLCPILLIGGIAMLAQDRGPLSTAGGIAVLASLICLFLGAIIWAVVSPILSPKRINVRFAWLKGMNDELLGELPEFPGEH